MAIRVIFHEYSGDDNEEMNIVLYGCRTFKPNGECFQGEETASILSNSRHPQTLAVSTDSLTRIFIYNIFIY